MTGLLRVLDLFSGAGGLSHGLASTGQFVTVSAVEQNSAAAATFSLNHPEAVVATSDIAAWLDAGDLPTAEVVIGGPPCQGFSNLGKRVVRDPRNALWRRYAETLNRVRPLVFVLENVSDFIKSGQFRDLRRETHRSGLLANYRIEATVLNSANFGSAQGRKRAVVMGSHRDLSPIGHPVPIAEWVAQPRTVREAIGDLPLDPHGVDLPVRHLDVAGQPLKGPFRSTELHLGRRPTELSLQRYGHIPPGGNRRDIPADLLSDCWKSHTSGSGDVMGRMHWDQPAVTIRTEFWKPEKGRYLHPTANRAITHLEAIRIQGFPDDYLWVGSKAAIGAQIGNAVPYHLAQAIGEHLAQHLHSDLVTGPLARIRTV